jgi:hypothetical protein
MRALALTLALLLAVLAVAGTASARPLPPVNQTCVGQPGAVAVCLTSGIGGTCLSAGVGLQGAYVCNGPNGLRVCTSMNTALYGYCPTDLVVN